MDIKEFVKKEAREELAREFTKEGLFELKEQEIRGNNYHVFANLPQTLRDYFQFLKIKLIYLFIQTHWYMLSFSLKMG